MSFLKTKVMPSDPKVIQISTLTGEILGWLKLDGMEWAYVAGGTSGARLNKTVLSEILDIIEERKA